MNWYILFLGRWCLNKFCLAVHLILLFFWKTNWFPKFSFILGYILFYYSLSKNMKSTVFYQKSWEDDIQNCEQVGFEVATHVQSHEEQVCCRNSCLFGWTVQVWNNIFPIALFYIIVSPEVALVVDICWALK